MVQETFLLPKNPDPHLPEYTTYREDRQQAATDLQHIKGGGLLTFVHTSLRSKRGANIFFSEDNATETLVVEIQRGGGLPPVTFVNLYRPPTHGGDLRSKVFQVASLPTGENTFIVGDFNAHHETWSSRQPDANGRRLFNWLADNRMCTWNDPSTATSTAFQSSPDLVISSTDFVTDSWRVLPAWGSDHRPVYFEIPTREAPARRPDNRPRYCWKLADWHAFSDELETSCHSLRYLSDTKFLAVTFTASFRKALRAAVPRKSTKQRGQPWWNESLGRAKEEVTRLAKALPGSFEQYKRAEDDLRKQIIEAKAAHWNRYVTSLGKHAMVRAVFKKAAELNGRSAPCTLPTLECDGELKHSPAEKASALASHYAQVCKKTANLQPWSPPSTAAQSIPEATGPFLQCELDRAIDELSDKQSLDPDGLNASALKRIGKLAKATLLRIYNKSWEEAFVPPNWKKARIIPVPKVGKPPSQVSSYRGISLTCVLAKLMEVLVKNRLVHLVERKEYPVESFAEAQAGFRKGRNTEEQVARVATAIHDASVAGIKKPGERGNHALLLLFDLEKAFDKVDPDALLPRLEKKGVPLKFLLWIRAFLRGRRACVDVDGCLSDEFLLEIGLPQGTVLGPFLFLVLVDELAAMLEKIDGVTLSLFADDIAIVVEGSSLQQMNATAQAAVDLVERWARETGMKIAFPKTKAIYFPPCRMSFRRNILSDGAGGRPPVAVVSTHFKSTVKSTTLLAHEVQTLALALDDNLFAMSCAPELDGAKLAAVDDSLVDSKEKIAEIVARGKRLVSFRFLKPGGSAHTVSLRPTEVAPLLRNLDASLTARRTDPKFFGMRLVGLDAVDSAATPTPTTTITTKNNLLDLPLADGSSLRLSFACAVPVVPSATLLGVIFSEGLDFSEHVNQLRNRASKRVNLLRMVAGSDWGYSSESLRALYVALVLSLFTYCMGVWGCFLKKNSCDDLESDHARALCYVLGLHRDTSRFAVYNEARIPPISLLIKSQAAGLAERLARTEAGSRWLHSSLGLPHGGKLAKNFRSLCEFAGTYRQPRELCEGNPFAPWAPDPPVAFHSQLPAKKSEDVAVNRAASLSALEKLPTAGIVIWTDGSVQAAKQTGHRNVPDVDFWGGSGAVVVFSCLSLAARARRSWTEGGRLANHVWDGRTLTLKFAAGCFPSSFRAEQIALWQVLFLIENCGLKPQQVNIITDSQSLLAALEGGSHSQTDPTNIRIWSSLRSLGFSGWKITMQFIFSHCDLPGNDAADAAAGSACDLGRDLHYSVPLTRSCSLARLKRVLWLHWVLDCDPENQYSEWVRGSRAPILEGITRRAEVEIRRLRTGHHALLRPYLSRDVWRSASRVEQETRIRSCPLCGQPSSLRHLFLECIGGNALAARLRTLVGKLDSWTDAPEAALRELLFARPRLALAYLQEAGLLAKFPVT